MPTKLNFVAIIVMVLICFVPITLLWLLAVLMLTGSYMDSLASDADSILFVMSSIILLFMGGVGLIGVIRMMNHIYKQGYRPADTNTTRYLYVGILSLVLLNIFLISMHQLYLLIPTFVTPIIGSLVLINLTHKKQAKKKLFDDQEI